MRDLHVNIEGPRNQARQNISFQVASRTENPASNQERIAELIAQMRTALAQSQLSQDDLRRVERRLASIEEESRSERPAQSEIQESLSFLGQLVQTAQGLAPLFGSAYQMLVTVIGR